MEGGCAGALLEDGIQRAHAWMQSVNQHEGEALPSALSNMTTPSVTRAPALLLAVAAMAALTLATSALTAPAAAQEGDTGPWPQHSGDAENHRQGLGQLPEDPGVGWAQDHSEAYNFDVVTGGDEHRRMNQPTLAPDGTIVLRGNDIEQTGPAASNYLIGLDPDNGAIAWEHEDVTQRCTQAIDGDGRLWAYADDDPQLYALDPSSGELDEDSIADSDVQCRNNSLHIGGDPEHLLVINENEGMAVFDLSGDAPDLQWEVDLTAEGEPFDELVDRDVGIPGSDASRRAVFTDDSLLIAGRNFDAEGDVESVDIVELALDDGEERGRVEVALFEDADGELDPATTVKVRLLRAGDTMVAGTLQVGTGSQRGEGSVAAYDIGDGLADGQDPAWVEHTAGAPGPTQLALGDDRVLTIENRDGEGMLRAYDLTNGSADTWLDDGAITRVNLAELTTDADGGALTKVDLGDVPGETEIDGNAVMSFASDGEPQWVFNRAGVAEKLDIEPDAFDPSGSLDLAPMDADGTVVVGGYGQFIAMDDSGGLGVAPPHEKVDDPDRVAGEDRQATAIELCQGYDAADEVLLARSDDYADALAGAPLAAQLDACILLTQSNQLDTRVADEIDRLGATSARLLGGTVALDGSVEQALTADTGVDSTQRYAGTNRFDTAAKIAEDLDDPDTAYVVRGRGDTPDTGWEDAVAVSALAAYEGNPILLVTTDAMPQETSQALDTQGFVDEAVIVGGPAVVSDGVERQLNEVMMTADRVSRIAGADRYATSADVADASVGTGMDPENTWVATGRGFADALAGAPIISGTAPAIADEGGVLLLVDGDDLSRSEASQQWLQANAGDIARIRTIGGPAAVSDAVTDEVRSAAGLD